METSFKFLLAAVYVLSSLSASAQNSGVFLKPDDYLTGNLSFKQSCSEGDGIKLNTFLGNSFVTLKQDGGKRKLPKDSIYAVLDCNGKTHRFYSQYGWDYLILEHHSLFIYSRSENVPHGKGYRELTRYYFSRTATSPIRPLQLAELKKAFADKSDLQDELDTFFFHRDVTAYDSAKGMFRVNSFLAGK